MRIGKSGYVELDGTHCCIGKFNMVLSLCGVLGITLYFSKDFSEAVVKAPQLLGQESNLWSPVPQQRHRLFLRHFLCSSLINLPLLASLEERSTHRELGCFLRAGDKNDFEEEILVNETTRDRFALFQKTTTRSEVEVFSYFQE